MFYYAINIKTINTTGWDTSNVSRICHYDGYTEFGIFGFCKKLENIIGIENWVTEKVDRLAYMFYGCQSLTSLNLNSWNTSNVTTMSSMFNNNTSLENLNIANFDLNKATGLDNLFTGCNKLDYIDCSNVDAYSVKIISGLLLYRTDQAAGTVVCKTVLETDTLNALSSRNWNVDAIRTETLY
jgi:surface protein